MVGGAKTHGCHAHFLARYWPRVIVRVQASAMLRLGGTVIMHIDRHSTYRYSSERLKVKVGFCVRHIPSINVVKT